MSNRGVTPNGFVKKRLDELISEVQSDITEAFGFDVSINPQSLLNVIIMTMADKCALLWEVAEQVYFSSNPITAEGVNLDYAAQLGGVVREKDKRTIYTVLCTGKDGTVILEGAHIASNTTPKVYFTATKNFEISKESFNKAVISVSSIENNANYVVSINGVPYAANSGEDASANSIVLALKNAISDEKFNVEVQDTTLSISCKDERSSNHLSLSENLTTESISSLVLFQSEEYGKFVLPAGTITEIVTTIMGFQSCCNLSSPSYGRLRETDIEFRQSYLQKISARSSMMLETIVTAIMENVENVNSAVAYQNDSNEDELSAAKTCIASIRAAETMETVQSAIDEYDENVNQISGGIPAHSVEVVVDGGSDLEIANQILAKKAAGIGTYGNVSVNTTDLFGTPICVRFSRPESLFVWLKVSVIESPTQSLPDDAAETIRNTITKMSADFGAGEAFLTQDFADEIRKNCRGISYVDVSAFKSTESSSSPDDGSYTEHFVYPSKRQKVVIIVDDVLVSITKADGTVFQA